MGPSKTQGLAGDWRTPLLAGAQQLVVPALERDPTCWPGYLPRTAVTAWRLTSGPIAAVWDFSVYGGSFGEDDATVLVAAAAAAVHENRPLLTLLRSGGTRLQEGMAALVGIPRARIALLDLAAAGLPHLSVSDAPTTGGVWISVGAAADLRVAVEGATIGFAGPRVVEAVTGTLPAPGSHTATSAWGAGLVDAVLPADQVVDWLTRALTALEPGSAGSAGGTGPLRVGDQQGSSDQAQPAEPAVVTTVCGGWEQVQRSRAPRPDGRELLDQLLPGGIDLRAPRGDTTVAARLGRLGGLPVIGVATAARQGGRPTPDGYRLLTRAARLADRLGIALLSLVDTPGAEPGTASEEDGIAGAMGEALDALLLCRSPTIALVHGEGGSGGALAAAACDLLLVAEGSYFAAIGPEGASAALRKPPQDCAELLRLTPVDLLTLGAVDGLAEPADLAEWLVQLSDQDPRWRQNMRRTRWSRTVPGYL